MSPRGFKLSTPVGKVVRKISNLLRTQQRTSGHGPSPSPSPLNVVPIDVIEDILLCLSGQDILRMKQVRLGDSSMNV